VSLIETIQSCLGRRTVKNPAPAAPAEEKPPESASFRTVVNAEAPGLPKSTPTSSGD
jgi:hypothetical protein